MAPVDGDAWGESAARRRRCVRYQFRAADPRHRERRRQLDPHQAEPDRNAVGDAGGDGDRAPRRLLDRHQPSLRRDRGCNDRRSRGGDERRADQDRQPRAQRAEREIQPAHPHRADAGRRRTLRRPHRAAGVTDGRAIRAAGAEDAPWIASYLREQWHATVMVVHGERIDLTLLPALIAGDRRGLLTWRRLGDDAELASINATPPWEGTGTALVEALVAL